MDQQYLEETFQRKKKKPPANAFFYFMQELRDKLIRQGKLPGSTSMAKMPPIAANPWNSMLPSEKEYYQLLAKKNKAAARSLEGGPFLPPVLMPDRPRVVTPNVDAIQLAERERKQKEKHKKQREADKKSFPCGKEVCCKSFYFIHFELLIELPDASNPTYCRPVEMAIAEYNLEEGVKECFHRFIHPGEIPVGYRFEAKQTTEDYHKIPAQDFADARSDYRNLWNEMCRFINPQNGPSLPPLYTNSMHSAVAETCIAWLSDSAGVPNRLRESLRALEGLMLGLHSQALSLNFEWNEDKNTITEGWAFHLISTPSYDEEIEIRCLFHQGWYDEKDEFGIVEDSKSHVTRNCCLAVVHGYCYAVSECCCEVFGINMTSKHMAGLPDPKAPGEVSDGALSQVELDTSLLLSAAGVGRGVRRDVEGQMTPGKTTPDGELMNSDVSAAAAALKSVKVEEETELPPPPPPSSSPPAAAKAEKTSVYTSERIPPDVLREIQSAMGIHHPTSFAAESPFPTKHASGSPFYHAYDRNIEGIDLPSIMSDDDLRALCKPLLRSSIRAPMAFSTPRFSNPRFPAPPNFINPRFPSPPVNMQMAAQFPVTMPALWSSAVGRGRLTDK